ncbi:MAG: hypothetical protein PHE67_00655 [Campylobacterales bacterium]|nr:hypothetical protein [Campylobacterales bacterium]
MVEASKSDKIFVTTNNVKNSLIAIARICDKRNITFLDFAIESFKTVYLHKKNEIILDDSQFNPFNEEHIIIQKYEISIFKSEGEVKEPKVLLKANPGQYIFEVDAIFSDDGFKFDVRDVKGFLTELLRKKKLKHGFLIDISESEMHYGIELLSAHILSNHGYIKEKINVPLVRMPKPILGVKPSMEILSTIKSSGKFGTLVVCKKDIAFLISKRGLFNRHGRSADGTIVISEQNADINPTILECSAEIYSVECEDGIEYIANSDGCVLLSGDTIKFFSHLDMEEISFRKTGNVELPTTEIIVCANNDLTDSVSNTKIECSKLVVNGTVGGMSTAIVDSLYVDGQSSNGSKMFSKGDAGIKYHKGFTSCKTAHINVLENGGRVDATVAKIDIALGGTVTADEIYIGELRGNNTLIASKKIVIENVLGTGNTLIIQNGISNVEMFEIEDKQSGKCLLLKKRQSLEKQIAEVKTYLKRHAQIIKEIEAQSNSANKSNIALPAHTVNILKQANAKKEHLNKLQNDISNIDIELRNIERLTHNIETAIHDGVIMVRGQGIKLEDNNIFFKTSFPKKEYKPELMSGYINKFFMGTNFKIVGEKNV